MGLFNSMNQWRMIKDENRITNMKQKNICPSCHGRGFYPFSANEFVYYASPTECPTCQGSGMYITEAGAD